MKYAILAPKGRILKILDESNDRTVEITNAKAVTVNASELPMFLIDGELKTQAEFQAIQKAKRVAAMSPEDRAEYEARLQAKAAYDVAAAAFEAMPKGKQLLWEAVRNGVAKSILAGDIATAVEILQTTPVIYEGAEADRDAFLALFK
jgi:hypothetical protein